MPLAWQACSPGGGATPLRGPHQAPSVPELVRVAQPLPEPRPAIGRPQEVHLRLHGVSAEEIVAILNRRDNPP